MESDYTLETEKIIERIKKTGAKLVCLQFPDGLKQHATEIAEEVESETGARCFIWFGSCFGACDVPLQDKDSGFGLLVQFGHSEWKFNQE